MSEWLTHDSRRVYENAWISVREDSTTRPDGGDGIYGVVTVRHTAVFVVALTDADEVLLVRLFRYPTGRWSVEVPAGGSDGQDLLVAAKRELLEETGCTAGDWKRLGAFTSLNGVANAPAEVFLARGVTRVVGADRTQAEEGITAVLRVTWAEAWGMVRRGEIDDSETMAALLLAQLERGI